MRFARLLSFATCAWIAASILGISSPLRADLIYVPALSLSPSQGTEVTLYNDGGKAASYRYAINGGIGPANGESGTISPGGFALLKFGAQTGVVAIETTSAVHVAAWLRNRVNASQNFFAGISRVYDGAGAKANSDVDLYHLHQGIGQLHVLNMGNAPASCTAKSSLVDEQFDVPAKQIGVLEAIGTAKRNEALVVRCNQMFHAYAVIQDDDRMRISNAAQSPPNEPVGVDDQEWFDDANVSYEWLGMFHQPSTTCNSGPKKGFLVFYLDAAGAATRVRARMDQKLGTFFKNNKGGVHNFFWIHRNNPRQPFKSNNLGNVNALGTGKNRFRVNQNIDLPKGQVTKVDGGYKWVQHDRYLVAYEHDPVNKEMKLELSQKGDLLVNLKAKATGFDKQVTLPQGGIVAEYGNRCGDPPPEVPGNSDWYAHDWKLGLVMKQTNNKK